MGPSGSGKTSLLNALAQRTPVTSLMTLSGRLHINGRDPGAAGAPRAGYVPQEDLFYSQMTVQETLDMVATLRLPKGTSADVRDYFAGASVSFTRLQACNGCGHAAYTQSMRVVQHRCSR